MNKIAGPLRDSRIASEETGEVPAAPEEKSARQKTHLLMCAPTDYNLAYEINPWMSLHNLPDTKLAAEQWHRLYHVLKEEVRAEITLVPQASDCPDMVFTANAGLTLGGIALLSRFRHVERQGEEPHFRAWFEENGYRVETPPSGCHFEGEGDALFAGDTLLAGYLKRSDIVAHRWMSEVFAQPVLSLELVDDRWYHLDTCLFPLNARTLVFYPGAFDRYACDVIRDSFQTIEVCEAEALRFACNAVVANGCVVLPTGCPQLTGSLTELGYRVYGVELSEFLKAGGSAKCLTLFLRSA